MIGTHNHDDYEINKKKLLVEKPLYLAGNNSVTSDVHHNHTIALGLQMIASPRVSLLLIQDLLQYTKIIKDKSPRIDSRLRFWNLAVKIS